MERVAAAPPGGSGGGRLVVLAGVLVAVAPDPVLGIWLLEAWEALLGRWFGWTVALSGWTSRALAARGIGDPMYRIFTLLGYAAGGWGILGPDRVFLLAGFSVLVAAVCRGGLVVGIDVQQSVLRRIDG